jgi:hypothetical protein
MLISPKKAWHDYPVMKCNMSFDKSLGPAMKRGGLDIPRILPRDEIVPFGIPYLCWTLEVGIDEWEIKGWDIFWKYFQRQWIPLIPNWNVRMDDGTILPRVNRTNNALEHYNQRVNKFFDKKPSLMKFVLVIEEESHHQAQKLQDIRTGRLREVKRNKVWCLRLP